jgi:hypothetical protein
MTDPRRIRRWICGKQVGYRAAAFAARLAFFLVHAPFKLGLVA